jgi:hypothetical protein
MLDKIITALRSLTPAQRKAIGALLTALVGLLAAFGLGVTGTATTGVSVTTVRGPAGPTTVVAPAKAVESARETSTHQGARDEDPGTATSAELAAAKKQQLAFSRSDRLPPTIPLAAPSQPGCRTRMVVNKSSRHGVRPRLLVMHYTVSPNRPGFQDVNAITTLFNQRSFAASSTYVIDRDGNCNYIVAEAEKPWTQAAANPVSISWEIINTGSERPLFTKTGLKKMARIVSDSARRWHIPIRAGKVRRGCLVVRSGVIDHRAFGACGGNHGDIYPFSTAPIIAAAKAHRVSPAKRRCDELRALRQRARWRKRTGRTPTWTKDRAKRARALKRALGAKAAACR